MSDEKVWFVHRTGRDLVGPVSANLIHRGFKEGKIPEDSIVAREGDDEWIPVGDLVAKLDLFEDDPTQHVVNPFLTDVHPAVKLDGVELPSRRQALPIQRPPSAKTPPGQTFMVFIPGSREPPRGPWGLDEIRARRESGALLATAKVCRVGDARWGALDEVIAAGEPATAAATPTTGNSGSGQPSAAAEAPTMAAPTPGFVQRWRGTPLWLRAAGGAGLDVALVTVWLSTRSGAVLAPAATSSSTDGSAAPRASSAQPLPEENEVAAEAERRRLSDAEAEKAREQESICAAKGKWPLAPSLAGVSALGPWVVTGHEMATERASKVTISELGGEKVATEIERLEKSVQEIDAHALLPGEEKIKKQLLADFKSLIALNKRWRAAMVGYSGSLRPFDGLPEATTSTVTKVSSNDGDRLQACLALAKLPSAADDAAPKPAPAPKKKACSSCTYNGRCARLGGPLPCCEPITEHVSEDPKEAARCRQLGM